MFTVIVPFRNGHHHLDRLLTSIPDSINVLVIDDMSEPPIENAGRATVHKMVSRGYFTGAVNEGIRRSDGDVLILNQDVYFENGKWLRWLRKQKKEYDLIGEGVLAHPAWPKGYIHGTFMFIKRKVIDAIGQMNEIDYPLWGSTCEYQLRAARKGFRFLPMPQGTIPGFVHSRKGGYGEAIIQTLRDEGQRGRFIRTPPMISVVIGCYNHGQFLPDAINSLIGGKTCLGEHPGQTFQSFDVIIVDDGSTDNTPEICKRLVSAEKGIRYIRQHNMGSAVAANTGIQHTRGRFIAPLDADDMMEPERLESMYRLIEENPHSVIYDDVAYFSQSKGNKWVRGFTTKRGWELTMKLPQYNFEELIHKNGMHKGLLFSRQAWEEVGGYPATMDRGREDWAFNVALGMHGYCGVHTGKAEYLYRRNWTSRTFTNTTRSWHAFFKGQLEELFPDIYRGERPMDCCGGGGRRSTNVKPKAKAMNLQSLPGAKAGMVILEYNGKNAGDETWYGEVTKQVYILGGITKRGYVDREDAGSRPTLHKDGHGMLNLRASGRYLFKLYEPPVVNEVIEPEPEAIAEDFKESGKKEELAIAEYPVLEVSKMSINGVTIALRAYPYTKDEIADALEAERSNKNRVTLIKMLEAKLV